MLTYFYRLSIQRYGVYERQGTGTQIAEGVYPGEISSTKTKHKDLVPQFFFSHDIYNLEL